MLVGDKHFRIRLEQDKGIEDLAEIIKGYLWVDALGLEGAPSKTLFREGRQGF
jgi:hypothetical protein